MVLDWERQGHDIARLQGLAAWGKNGISVNPYGHLRYALYEGEAFDSNMAALIPKDPRHLRAIWAFCISGELDVAVRRIDAKVYVTNATLVKVPFDIGRWELAAERIGPVPEPHTDDPTQWIFTGDPYGSAEPLQVAVARLLGYIWPQQESSRVSKLVDEDGILPFSGIANAEPAADRLRAILALVYGGSWSPKMLEQLLHQVGYGGTTLDHWLRNGFFEQHCKVFHQRPFIWHIWDGRRDGFSVLVNYHQLDAAHLDKLIYTYLGEWIRTQRAARDRNQIGADALLVAALELQKKLEAIRDGEPPYDLHIRWKPLAEQPIGWNPDLNDGVRLNIRPFVTAGVLRSKVNVNWNTDRGLNPGGSARMNDLHYTNAEKRAARETARVGAPAPTGGR